MQEKTIEFETLSLPFTIEEDNWKLYLAKSQTRINNSRQVRVLTKAPADIFVPVDVEEEKDSFTFTFFVEQTMRKWEDLRSLHRNEKLRLLCNVAQLKDHLDTRVTFFLHPDNLVFDDNLMPYIIYRGVRQLIPPFEMSEEGFMKQLQCLSIALFSQKYNFDQLYHGALKDVEETEFERQVSETTELNSLIDYLQESYRHEQQTTEKNMSLVPVKRFRLFKQLAIIMIVVSVLLAAPLVYLSFFKLPYDQSLQDAHKEYLASDDGEVISTLEDQNADKLPQETKYILADAYINVADLADYKKENIQNNISLKSDESYLLYWIYNGRGELDDALDTAKYLDDGELIIHGLVQQIEAAKDDPDLSSSERDEELKELNSELDEYKEEYGLDEDDEAEGSPTDETDDDKDSDEDDD